ncbi:hypothetical protein AKJ16_DCAP18254 [Drosera capensis]
MNVLFGRAGEYGVWSMERGATNSGVEGKGIWQHRQVVALPNTGLQKNGTRIRSFASSHLSKDRTHCDHSVKKVLPAMLPLGPPR